jgi:hypothetical protein
MSPTRALQNLAPETLVEQVTTSDLRDFVESYGDALLLLVRIPEGETELELGLNAHAGATRSARPRPLPFRTTHQAAPSEPRGSRDAPGESPAGVRRLLEEHSWFAVPLLKREGSSVLFSDRISVGRAQNKDIMLRHVSISKFHAWFEMDESKTLYVCDWGSTNLTYVNGRPVEPRTAMAIGGGDAIRFGVVETVLCAPETLWACLNTNDPNGETGAGADVT